MMLRHADKFFPQSHKLSPYRLAINRVACEHCAFIEVSYMWNGGRNHLKVTR